MKFRRLIAVLIIATILIAFFTNPKESDFEIYIQPVVARQTTAPLIQYDSKLIYSDAIVTYFNPISIEGKLVASASKENYIGLFGRFWKLNN